MRSKGELSAQFSVGRPVLPPPLVSEARHDLPGPAQIESALGEQLREQTVRYAGFEFGEPASTLAFRIRDGVLLIGRSPLAPVRLVTSK